MLTGLLKLPVESESCTVKTLPELKVPVMVNGTLSADPAQSEAGREPVLMVCACNWQKNNSNMERRR